MNLGLGNVANVRAYVNEVVYGAVMRGTSSNCDEGASHPLDETGLILVKFKT